jgi:pimeloyl-ACP methyl ester carboxylesterase
LVEGVNLAAYNTAENAADVNDLRLALGYDQVNLYGVSYGTMLAQAMLRDFPEGVRSAVLDSAYPLDTSLPADSPAGVSRLFDAIFANCAADGLCNAVYPDARSVFNALRDRLKRDPLDVTVQHPLTGETYTFTFDDDDLIVRMLSTHPGRVPALLFDLRDGSLEPILAAVRAEIEAAQHGGLGSVSAGMKTSILCSQRLFHAAPDQLARAKAAHPETAVVADLFTSDRSLCDVWPAHPIDERDAQPVTSDVPTLILTGQYDPGVTPAYGEQLAARSKPGYAYVIPNAGHGVLNAATPCVTGILLSFLNDPMREPDTQCVAGLRPIEFALRQSLSRGPVGLMSLALMGTLTWSAGRALAGTRRPGRAFTLSISTRLIGWLPPVGAAILIVLGYLIDVPNLSVLENARVVETIAPLIAALHAASIFSPDDEPALEVTLACPRPMAWTLLERVGVLLALHGGVALAGSIVIAGTAGESAAVAIARWLAPMLVLVGLSVCLTLITRQALSSAGMVVLLWFGLSTASETVVTRWPFLWPIGLYLQPDNVDFALNRAFLVLIGLGLFALAATHLLRDEERVLIGRSIISRSRIRHVV